MEYELRCLLNKPGESPPTSPRTRRSTGWISTLSPLAVPSPEKDWTEEDKNRDQELMAELVTIIEQRNQIVNSMDQDRQRSALSQVY